MISFSSSAAAASTYAVTERTGSSELPAVSGSRNVRAVAGTIWKYCTVFPDLSVATAPTRIEKMPVHVGRGTMSQATSTPSIVADGSPENDLPTSVVPRTFVTEIVGGGYEWSWSPAYCTVPTVRTYGNEATGPQKPDVVPAGIGPLKYRTPFFVGLANRKCGGSPSRGP